MCSSDLESEWVVMLVEDISRINAQLFYPCIICAFSGGYHCGKKLRTFQVVVWEL